MAPSTVVIPTFHSFEQVTVTEIAAAAAVAEKTVYNYFPVKAALVFDAGDELLEELLSAIRERGTGMPAVTRIRTFIDRRDARAERQSDWAVLALLATLMVPIAAATTVLTWHGLRGTRPGPAAGMLLQLIELLIRFRRR